MNKLEMTKNDGFLCTGAAHAYEKPAACKAKDGRLRNPKILLRRNRVRLFAPTFAWTKADDPISRG
jgi:hypothetical protein